MNKSGFMLLEAILTIVIVSICLTFIAQSLLTNSRTSGRFQETVRSLLVMENRMGLLFATTASDDQLDTAPKSLEDPYERFSVAATTDTVNDHLKKVGLAISWPQGRGQSMLDATTIVYNPNET